VTKQIVPGRVRVDDFVRFHRTGFEAARWAGRQH